MKRPIVPTLREPRWLDAGWGALMRNVICAKLLELFQIGQVRTTNRTVEVARALGSSINVAYVGNILIGRYESLAT